jgi:hypothetical protein
MSLTRGSLERSGLGGKEGLRDARSAVAANMRVSKHVQLG